MKRTVGILIVVALAAVAGYYGWRAAHPPPSNKIVISGNIELTEMNIAFKTAGRLIERTVNEGDPVRKGMVIARIDRDQLENQLATQEAAVRGAQYQVEQAGTSVELQSETVEHDIQQRRADLAVAEARLKQLEAGARPQEIAEARSAVDAARAEAVRAKSDWDRAQVLRKDEDITQAQFDSYRSRYESSQATLQQAEQRLNLIREGARKEDLDAARAQVERAKAIVALGESSRMDIKRRKEEYAAREADAQRTRAQVGLVEAQLRDTIAASPIDGVVLVKSADVGEVLAPGTSVVTIGDIDHPWLRGYVSEKDLARVRLGAPVKVSTDSYPGRTYSGRIAFIASEAEFTPKQIQTKDERVKLVYRIKIDIENSRHDLKLNMPADAEIQVE